MKLIVTWVNGDMEEFTLPKDAKAPQTSQGTEWKGWLVFNDKDGARQYIQLQHVREYKVLP